MTPKKDDYMRGYGDGFKEGSAVMLTALEYARDKMWAYGFPENEMQPIRDAIARAETK